MCFFITSTEVINYQNMYTFNMLDILNMPHFSLNFALLNLRAFKTGILRGFACMKATQITIENAGTFYGQAF